MAIKKKLSKKEKQRLNPNSRLWRNKALKLWSECVRRAGVCEVCGVPKTEKVLNAHHLLPKERYKEYMFEVINGVSLCQMCHKFSKYSAHFNGIWFANWLQMHRPEKHQWVIDHMMTSQPIITYKENYENLEKWRTTLNCQTQCMSDS